jgi:hypothetical protein
MNKFKYFVKKKTKKINKIKLKYYLKYKRFIKRLKLKQMKKKRLLKKEFFVSWKSFFIRTIIKNFLNLFNSYFFKKFLLKFQNINTRLIQGRYKSPCFFFKNNIKKIFFYKNSVFKNIFNSSKFLVYSKMKKNKKKSKDYFLNVKIDNYFKGVKWQRN